MTSIAPLSSAATPSSASTSQSTAGSETLTDYDDFLTLLTTQLRNQDPLNPADGTEFVSQIAQFTAVEQQVATVDRLDQLIALQTSGSLAELGAWVGRDIEASKGSVFYSGSDVALDIPAESGASAGQLVIRAQDGREVRSISLADPAAGGSLTWDGLDNTGAAVDSGVYSVELRYTKEDATGEPITSRRDLSASGRVTEARVENGATLLILANGVAVDDADVTSITAATE